MASLQAATTPGARVIQPMAQPNDSFQPTRLSLAVINLVASACLCVIVGGRLNPSVGRLKPLAFLPNGDNDGENYRDRWGLFQEQK